MKLPSPPNWHAGVRHRRKGRSRHANTGAAVPAIHYGFQGMARTERQLDLMQLLRRHRRPVTGQVLAAELGISLRTVCRDIATLQALGAAIAGEPGQGYVLLADTTLPPLMFTAAEIAALELGARWVMERGDDPLAAAARAALARIAAIRPADDRDAQQTTMWSVPLSETVPNYGTDLSAVRAAIRRQRKIMILYRDPKRGEARRMIWPLTLGFLDHSRVLVGRCERTGEVESFQTDRIITLVVSDSRYPGSRHAVLRAWREDKALTSP